MNPSCRGYNNNCYYVIYQGRSGWGQGGNILDPTVTEEAIIVAIITTNTINIVHMMMDHMSNNMAHHAHFVVDLTILLNIVSK